MAERQFFEADGRERTTLAIRAIEAQTSAEVVVEVRHYSGRYRDADFLCGFVFALATLLILLYAPRAFALIGFPVQTALGFVAGAALSSRIAWLRRLFVSRHAMRQEVYRAARASFYDLGVARCQRRGGVLVMVGSFERRVEVVTDIGIDVAALGTPWKDALDGMEAAVRSRDFNRFVASLEALGPVLGRALPHRDDDVNELPDGVSVDPRDESARA